ncbi:MAG TPA: hypothetical protein VMG12_35990 [Polyangiaceae bacterium]|nr:hypothetical protein [Polyangiaceae bacterium]
MNCGYDGPFPPPEPDPASARDSLPSFAGARAKLATATQDLFRLSGSHSLPSPSSNSIPVEASVSEPPAPSASDPASSARKPEASIMFSLEALMKANQAPAKPEGAVDEATKKFWEMQASEPLFGTSADQALLTTPLKMEPAQSMDSMTLPSETPNGRRWWPIAVAATAGLALAAGGIWVFGSASHAVTPPTAASEQAKIEAQPPVEPPAVLPAPTAEAAGAEHAPAPSETGEPAPTAPSPVEPAPDAVTAAVPAPPVPAPPVAAADSSKDKDKDKPSSRKPAPRATPPRAAPVMSKTIVPFDKNAAKTALNDAASKAATCGAGGAPGKGKIQVTFGVNGKVSDAQLVEGPFGGTTAGKCALKHFRAAKVPAFAGSPVTVAKSFKVD